MVSVLGAVLDCGTQEGGTVGEPAKLRQCRRKEVTRQRAANASRDQWSRKSGGTATSGRGFAMCRLTSGSDLFCAAPLAETQDDERNASTPKRVKIFA